LDRAVSSGPRGSASGYYASLKTVSKEEQVAEEDCGRGPLRPETTEARRKAYRTKRVASARDAGGEKKKD